MSSAVVPADEESQIRSIEAKARFEGKHGGDPDWLTYWDLLEDGWPWRKAAYITWVIMPRDQRAIRTEKEFAVRELGLTSARKIRDWKNDELFVDFIRQTAQARLATARLDIWEALIESASNPNPRNHADRKMALQMLGDHEETLRIGAIQPDDLQRMTEEEKRARLRELRRKNAAE
jgi:hypothetical protein